MENIAVTGGRGFIGSHLVDYLGSLGYSPVIIDSLANSASGWTGFEKYSFYNADITNGSLMRKIFEKERIDTCVHLAALISVVDSIQNPVATINVNINGTASILEACAASKVSNFVLASTGAIYGEPQVLPIREDHAISPLSPYGASKIASELLSQAYMNCGKIKNAISLRFFNVYGRRQSDAYAGVIKVFAERIAAGRPPIIRGDGEQTRDFVFVDDVVRAIALAAEHDSVGGAFNIATGKNIRIKDLADMMIKLFGVSLVPQYTDALEGEVRAALVDISKANSLLGYKPQVALEEGLLRTFEVVAKQSF